MLDYSQLPHCEATMASGDLALLDREHRVLKLSRAGVLIDPAELREGDEPIELRWFRQPSVAMTLAAVEHGRRILEAWPALADGVEFAARRAGDAYHEIEAAVVGVPAIPRVAKPKAREKEITTITDGSKVSRIVLLVDVGIDEMYETDLSCISADVE